MPVVYACKNGKCGAPTRSDSAGSCDTCRQSLAYTWEPDPEPTGETDTTITDESGAVANIKGHLASLVPTLQSKVIVHIKKLAASDADYRPQVCGSHTCEHDSEKNGGNYQTIFYEVVVKGREINVVGLGNHEGKGSTYKVVWDTGSKESVRL